MACVLLVGAGLLIRSFMRVLQVDMGFEPERAATLRVDPPSILHGAERVIGYFNEVFRRLREFPGVEGRWADGCAATGEEPDLGRRAEREGIYEGRLPVGVHSHYQRWIFSGDGDSAARGARFHRSMTRVGARRRSRSLMNRWRGSCGRGRIRLGREILNPDPITVVGVVGDVRHLALEKDSGMELYFPIRQTGDFASVDIVVRARTAPEAMAGAVRAALLPVNPNIPSNEFRPLETVVDKAVSPRRFIVLLLGGFAGIALVLASLGIYGVISYAVSQKTQEIGIRMALGASSSHVRLRVLRQAMACSRWRELRAGRLGGLGCFAIA